MAKKFLETLADPFEEELLTDIIPNQKRTAQKPGEKASPARRAGSSRRKKKFVGKIGEALGEQAAQQLDLFQAEREKQVLEKIDEALAENAFDQLFPSRRLKRSGGKSTEEDLQVRFSTMITARIFDRAKEIAQMKGIRVKDVINIALKKYVEMEA